MVLGILLLSAIIVVGFYYYHLGYWKRRDIPGPPGKLFFGHAKQLGIHEEPDCFKLEKWTKQYGGYFGLQRGWGNVLVISDPDMVAEMMGEKFDRFYGRMLPPTRDNVDDLPEVNVFSAQGNRWKRLRALSNPAFSVGSLKKIIPVLHDSACETANFLDKKAKTGEEFNIHPFFHEFTMDTICRIAMGQTESRQFKNEYTQILLNALSNVNHPVTDLAWIAPLFKRVLGLIFLAYIKLNATGFSQLLIKCRNAVRDRKEVRAKGFESENEVDFIDLFLDAESDDTSSLHSTTTVYNKSNLNFDKKLTEGEVVAQCFVFLIAGFDTTANTLALTAYYLAVYPELQQRLRDEINEHCLSDAPEYEELQKLKLADAIMKEVLRLHPVGTGVFNRRAATDTSLGKVPIERGTYIQVDTISLHRNKSVWGEDADEFKPDRFLTGKPTPPLYGFGGGPRQCVGMRLAYLEDKIALLHILRRFNILKTENTRMPDFNGLIVLNPDQITVKLEEI